MTDLHEVPDRSGELADARAEAQATPTIPDPIAPEELKALLGAFAVARETGDEIGLLKARIAVLEALIRNAASMNRAVAEELRSLFPTASTAFVSAAEILESALGWEESGS